MNIAGQKHDDNLIGNGRVCKLRYAMEMPSSDLSVEFMHTSKKYASLYGQISLLNLMQGLSISISGRWKEGRSCPLRSARNDRDYHDYDYEETFL